MLKLHLQKLVKTTWMEQTVKFEVVNGEKVARKINDLTQGSIIPKFKNLDLMINYLNFILLKKLKTNYGKIY